MIEKQPIPKRDILSWVLIGACFFLLLSIMPQLLDSVLEVYGQFCVIVGVMIFFMLDKIYGAFMLGLGLHLWIASFWALSYPDRMWPNAAVTFICLVILYFLNRNKLADFEFNVFLSLKMFNPVQLVKNKYANYRKNRYWKSSRHKR